MISTMKGPIGRAISSATLFFFLISNTAWGLPAGGVSVMPSKETPGFLQIEIPPELASIEEVYEAPPKPDPRLILHIQNLHGNESAQTQIKKLLGYLYEKYGFKMLFAEGAVEELNPAYLRLFPDKERNIKLAEALVKQGELTGVELYLVDGPQDVRAIGIEKADLYRSNYEAFRKVFGAKAETDRFLVDFDGKLETISSRIFPAETRRILSEWKKFEAGHREFLPFVKRLAQDSKRVLGLDLESLFAQVEWPQITRLLVIQAMEKEMNREAAMAERTRLIAFLKTKGIPQEIIASIEKLGERKITVSRKDDPREKLENLPRYLFERLVEEAGPKGFYFHDYPAFSLWAGHLILESELDSKQLFEEIHRIFEKILLELASTEPQKNLLELYQDNDLLRKLYALEVSRKEWERVLYRREWIRPEIMAQRLGKMGKGAMGNVILRPKDEESREILRSAQDDKLSFIFTTALEFYDFAHKREDVFYETIEREMTKSKTDKAVLVTGGFHTDGIMEKLREHEINYSILMPRITGDLGNENYVSAMLENRKTMFSLATLEKILLTLTAEHQKEMGLTTDISIHNLIERGIRTNFDDFLKNDTHPADPVSMAAYLNGNKIITGFGYQFALTPGGKAIAIFKDGQPYRNSTNNRPRGIRIEPVKSEARSETRSIPIPALMDIEESEIPAVPVSTKPLAPPAGNSPIAAVLPVTSSAVSSVRSEAQSAKEISKVKQLIDDSSLGANNARHQILDHLQKAIDLAQTAGSERAIAREIVDANNLFPGVGVNIHSINEARKALAALAKKWKKNLPDEVPAASSKGRKKGARSEARAMALPDDVAVDPNVDAHTFREFYEKIQLYSEDEIKKLPQPVELSLKNRLWLDGMLEKDSRDWWVALKLTERIQTPADFSGVAEKISQLGNIDIEGMRGVQVINLLEEKGIIPPRSETRTALGSNEEEIKDAKKRLDTFVEEIKSGKILGLLKRVSSYTFEDFHSTLTSASDDFNAGHYWSASQKIRKILKYVDFPYYRVNTAKKKIDVLAKAVESLTIPKELKEWHYEDNRFSAERSDSLKDILARNYKGITLEKILEWLQAATDDEVKKIPNLLEIQSNLIIEAKERRNGEAFKPWAKRDLWLERPSINLPEEVRKIIDSLTIGTTEKGISIRQIQWDAVLNHAARRLLDSAADLSRSEARMEEKKGELNPELKTLLSRKSGSAEYYGNQLKGLGKIFTERENLELQSALWKLGETIARVKDLEKDSFKEDLEQSYIELSRYSKILSEVYEAYFVEGYRYHEAFQFLVHWGIINSGQRSEARSAAFDPGAPLEEQLAGLEGARAVEKVLVVAGNEPMRESSALLLSALLKDKTVLQTSSLSEALPLMSQEKIDLVFVDAKNGINLAQAIRTGGSGLQPADTPVVIFSGNVRNLQIAPEQQAFRNIIYLQTAFGKEKIAQILRRVQGEAEVPAKPEPGLERTESLHAVIFRMMLMNALSKLGLLQAPFSLEDVEKWLQDRKPKVLNIGVETEILMTGDAEIEGVQEHFTANNLVTDLRTNGIEAVGIDPRAAAITEHPEYYQKGLFQKIPDNLKTNSFGIIVIPALLKTEYMNERAIRTQGFKGGQSSEVFYDFYKAGAVEISAALKPDGFALVDMGLYEKGSAMDALIRAFGDAGFEAKPLDSQNRTYLFTKKSFSSPAVLPENKAGETARPEPKSEVRANAKTSARGEGSPLDKYLENLPAGARQILLGDFDQREAALEPELRLLGKVTRGIVGVLPQEKIIEILRKYAISVSESKNQNAGIFEQAGREHPLAASSNAPGAVLFVTGEAPGSEMLESLKALLAANPKQYFAMAVPAISQGEKDKLSAELGEAAAKRFDIFEIKSRAGFTDLPSKILGSMIKAGIPILNKDFKESLVQWVDESAVSHLKDLHISNIPGALLMRSDLKRDLSEVSKKLTGGEKLESVRAQAGAFGAAAAVKLSQRLIKPDEIKQKTVEGLDLINGVIQYTVSSDLIASFARLMKGLKLISSAA